MGVTFFDLDHTLIPIDSDHAWGESTVAGLGRWRFLTCQRRLLRRSTRRAPLDIHAYIRFYTAAICRQGATNSIAAHADFMGAVVQNAIRPWALEPVQAHQRAGDVVVIVTPPMPLSPARLPRHLG